MRVVQRQKPVTLEAEVPVQITHPDKLLFHQPECTKLAYIQYLVETAPIFLPYLRHRYITLVRCPDGVSEHRFYQKHVLPGAPDWLPSLTLEDGKSGIVVNKLAHLLYYGNLGTIEFHTSLGRVGEAGPTYLSFDLDPSTDEFEPVCEAALHLRDVLQGLGLNSVAKTSGGTGLQIFVPLKSPLPYEDTKRVVSFVGEYMASKWSGLITIERAVKDRGDKVYVDVPQHGPTRTLIAPYSVRARELATVSAPLLWTEVEQLTPPTAFTIWNMRERMERHGDIFGETAPVDVKPVLAALPG